MKKIYTKECSSLSLLVSHIYFAIYYMLYYFFYKKIEFN